MAREECVRYGGVVEEDFNIIHLLHLHLSLPKGWDANIVSFITEWGFDPRSL